MTLNAWAVFDLLVLIYWVGVALLIISEDREPTAAIAWLLVLFALPFVGLVLYFFLGRNWPAITQRSPTTRETAQVVATFMPTIYAPAAEKVSTFRRGLDPGYPRSIERLIERKSGAPILPVRTLDLFGSGAEYFDTLIADIRAAERFVHMQYFIWKRDELTARITEALLDRLVAGVEVRILNDYVGNVQYSKSELNELRKAGAIVGSDVTGLARLNYRNHRKITVIDGEIGHTGGFNIGQEYIDGGKRFPAWRDTGLRMTGLGVAEFEKLFDMRWYEVYREDLFKPEYYPDPDLPLGDIMVQTVHQGYDDPWNATTRAHQIAIAGARDRVLIQSPYFVPDMTTLDAMINAASGGTQVDFMITEWLDKKWPFWAAQSYFEPLLEAGGRIFLWQKGFFHSKALMVDGELASVGTLNMDIRSLKLHKELMVWIYDRDIARRAEDLWNADFADCRELTLDDVRSWGAGLRFRNSLARLTSQLL